ncbi:MAG: class I SAM-dependent methyltransferase [Actinobacteria bacterium]|nr:class I SAM-dependent methyltransferase [Actinomycetota bacterium]
MVDDVEGSRRFQVDDAAYDRFMGRYSRPLARVFADFAEVRSGLHVLDVGCGPGALTEELVARVGAEAVRALDPSEPFVAACAARHPGVDVRLGRAEALPFDDGSVDRVVAQLVLHFVSDPAAVAAEFARVLRPDGIAAACVWDFAEGMEMLRTFWDAALTVRRDAPDEATTLRFGGPGEIAALLDAAGFVDIEEAELAVASRYGDFDELWDGFLAGVGPAGTFCLSLDGDERAVLRHELHRRLGEPRGSFTLGAVARAACGRRDG